MKQTITAVIPVRGGSRRLKNKNILPFGDSNLLIHKIRQLKEVEAIDNIVVSSDSEEMLEMAIQEGVKIHRRGLPFADDITRTFNEVIVHVISEVEGEHIVWAQCTSPLVDAELYNEAINIYKSEIIEKQQFDSLCSVNLLKEFIWDENGSLNYDEAFRPRSQDLPHWFYLTFGIHILPRKVALECGGNVGKTPYLFEVDRVAAIDIDGEIDLEIAKALYNYQKNKSK